MCEWCVENNGEPIGCQDCGKMICWDHETSDDVFSRPYVTTSGDVYCVSCGQRADKEDEAANDEYVYVEYPNDWYDADMDFENEDSNGVYIGEDREGGEDE